MFVVLADYLFNEDSRFCILPQSFKDLKKSIDLDGDGKISEEELQKAIKTLQNHTKQKKDTAQKKAYKKFKKEAWF